MQVRGNGWTRQKVLVCPLPASYKGGEDHRKVRIITQESVEWRPHVVSHWPTAFFLYEVMSEEEGSSVGCREGEGEAEQGRNCPVLAGQTPVMVNLDLTWRPVAGFQAR